MTSNKNGFTFLGDISLNDDYEKLNSNYQNPFEDVIQHLSKENFVIGNLEAISFGENGVNEKKKTRLGIHPKSLHLLKHLNLDLLTLANNHIYDQLESGFKITISYLKENGINFVGARHILDSDEINTFKIADRTFCFLNYVHLETNPLIPEGAQVEVNIYNCQKIINEIEKCKRNGVLPILLLHWGMDNSRFPEPWQRRDARKFINAGAELIVGHHSHVLQGFEIINRKRVYYSLGNFAFSRHFNNGKYYDIAKRQRESVILKVTPSNDSMIFNIIPIKLMDLKVIQVKTSNLKIRSFFIPFVSNIVVWRLYSFYLNFIFKIGFYLFGNGRNPINQLRSIDKRKIQRLLQIIKIAK
jgi:poly-gamma-glutamate capsule biosynthesis protein CapA/YwtB (metallophosphatase superfamily)